MILLDPSLPGIALDQNPLRGKVERYCRAGAEPAGDVQAAVVQFHKLLDQRQSEAGAAVLPGQRVFNLAEGRQRLVQVRGDDADALVS